MDDQRWVSDYTDREEIVIENVTASDNNGWSIQWGGCWIFFCPNDLCQQVPVAGENAILFGEFGRSIRGIVIGRRVYRYRSPEEREAAERAEILNTQAKKRSEFEAERTERNAAVLALPEVFRTRVERFQRVKGKQWRIDFEPYEVFVCQQAHVFMPVLQSLARYDEIDIIGNAAKRFYSMSLADQRALCPKMSSEHSGNTFGAAVRLAVIALDQPSLVAHAHGALCPLAGCVEYGCWAAYEGATGG